MKNKSGFTLIELLVVVLIIGILAAIALPMYTKTVEKSRMAEALLIHKALMDSASRFLMEQAPTDNIFTEEMLDNLDVELPQGEIEDNFFYTKNLRIYIACDFSPACEVALTRIKNKEENIYTLFESIGAYPQKYCYDEENTLGNSLCKGVASNGWELAADSAW